MERAMSFTVKMTNRYFNLPVRKGAGPLLFTILRGEQTVRYFKAEPGSLADHDFIAFYDMSEFRGDNLRIVVEGEKIPPQVEQLLTQSEEPLGLENLYQERHRPQLHFSSRRGWLNDPNGLVCVDGRWHLFYQHNPFSTDWGNMHWGHAVSDDLAHWRECDVTLHPDASGSMYSGSAIVDTDNTSGLGKDGRPPVLAFYTAAGDHAPAPCPYTQCMAYSQDGGATWRKYERNPVLPNIAPGNRDPKLVFHRPSGKWIMSLYLDSKDGLGRFGLYSSQNLKDWSAEQEFSMPGDECPDFFELPLDGDAGRSKWVFSNAWSHYLVGSFDGSTFTPEQEPLTAYDCHADRTAYAAQTYHNAPDGRIIQIAWIRQNLPGMPFNQFMSLPLELTLKTVDGRMRLFTTPVRELRKLHAENYDLDNIPAVKQLHLTIEFDTAQKAEVDVKGFSIAWDPHTRTLRCGSKTLRPHAGKRLAVELYADTASIELFINDGEFYVPISFEPDGQEFRPCIVSGSLASYAAHAVTSAMR